MQKSSKRKGKIVVYVTGHGLGHATRSIAICDELLARGFEVDVVSTGAVRSFFTRALGSRELFRFRIVAVDTGAVQENALAVDGLSSLNLYWRKIHLEKEKLVAREEAFLRESRADLVLTDTAAVPLLAASNLNIRSCILSNFTWDFIFQSFLNKHRDAIGAGSSSSSGIEAAANAEAKQRCADLQQMVDRMRGEFSLADSYLCYPGMAPFPQCTSELTRCVRVQITLCVRVCRLLVLFSYCQRYCRAGLSCRAR